MTAVTVTQRFALDAMATRFELVLSGCDATALRAIGEAVWDEVRDCESRLDLFSRGSLLALINRDAASQSVAVDRDTFDLLRACATIHRQSGGAFDPTVAPAMRALDLHGDRSTTAAGIVTGMHSVTLDADSVTVRFDDARTALDLGGIAKGHALDRAVAVLREHGVQCALLHGGTSTVVAIGAPPGQPGWRIAIGNGAQPPIAVLRDAALSVSGPHTSTDLRRAHILDPHAGTVAAALVGAVLAPSATLADGWSTALVASGGRARLDRGASLVAHPRGRWTLSGDLPPSHFCLPISA